MPNSTLPIAPTASDRAVLASIHAIPIGRTNRLLLRLLSINSNTIRKMISLLLHIELPYPPPKDLKIGHFFCIVVHPKAIIGNNVTLYQGVTIGEALIGRKRGVPEIGDDVIIYPNSVIVGSVRVGKGAVIGAGSIVTTDIPENAVVAGNPARVIRNLEHSVS